ncbi:MAG: ATP synthase subunit I [Cyanobium sp.]
MSAAGVNSGGSLQHQIGDNSTPGPGSDNGMEHYRRLQRRLLLATLAATLLAVPLSLWLFDFGTATSLLIGALAGLLYLQLLARSVSRLGVTSKSLGKVQLLVPVALVLAAARIPALQMLPALIGFLLYKPALIAQALLDD